MLRILVIGNLNQINPIKILFAELRMSYQFVYSIGILSFPSNFPLVEFPGKRPDLVTLFQSEMLGQAKIIPFGYSEPFGLKIHCSTFNPCHKHLKNAFVIDTGHICHKRISHFYGILCNVFARFEYNLFAHNTLMNYNFRPSPSISH